MKTTVAQTATGVRLTQAVSLMLSAAVMMAEAGTVGTWYYLRTNGVPQSPSTLAAGASGALWIASGSPNEKGVWRWSSGGELVHVTGDARENDLGRSSTMEVKAALAGLDVNFAVDDAAGNTWYATENGGARVQRSDQSWVVFSTTEAAPRQLANNVIRRIRPLNGGGAILIGPMGAYVINGSLEITQQYTGIVYNNDMINDVLRDSQGRWWVLDNRGPRRGDSLVTTAHVRTLYSASANLPENESPANRIEEDGSGNLWMIVNGYGTAAWYCLTATDAWEKYTQADVGGSSVAATELTVHPNGDVWFGRFYGHGLTRFRRGSGWTTISLASLGVESHLVNGLALVGNKLWFTSDYNPDVPSGGTGVHYLQLDANGDKTGQQLYSYLDTTTSLPSNRCRAVAADKSGNVWFGGYSTPALSRRRADGTWQIWRNTAGEGATTSPINFGIVAMGVDSANIVYFAGYNTPPFAFNATTEEWLSLPLAGSTGYTYGMYIDHQDNKWFYGADGAFKLSADNSTWTTYNTSGPGTGLPQNFVDYGIRVDRRGNVWFGTRGGLAMLRPGGEWKYFTGGTAGLPIGAGYKVILDDAGEVWTLGGHKYDYALGRWSVPEDKTLFENRNLRFTNGYVFTGTDTRRALGAVLDRAGAPAGSATEEDMMTLGIDGTVYQGQWAFSNDLGVLAFAPPPDALTIAPENRSHGAAPSAGHEIAVTATRGWQATTTASWIQLENGGYGAGEGVVRYALLANANALGQSRAGVITVTSQGGLRRTFNITQDGQALPVSGELLVNGSFDAASGANWEVAPTADRGVMFAVPGAADLHLTGFVGKLLWQPLNVPNAGGLALRVGATLRKESAPEGRTVAVYLEYLDGAGMPQRLLALNPANRDISLVPESASFEVQVTLPLDAQAVTGFSVDRMGAGDITAEAFTLTILGHAIPVVSMAQVQSIGVSADMPLNGNYVVMNDLSAEWTSWQDDGAGFRPVGGLLNSPFPFTGSFDGRDHRITGLAVDRPTMEPVGLFRSLAAGGVVRRLALHGGSLHGLNAVGAIAGMNDNGRVEECSSTALVSGFGNVGGLVGDNRGGRLEQCASLGPVTAMDAGGAAAGDSGGVVGVNTGLIRDAHASGPLFALNHAHAGGVAGANAGQGVIERAYAAGPLSVTNTTVVGGVVGDALDPSFIQACFWDSEATGVSHSDGGTAKTTALMQVQATFAAVGWDFMTVWDIREGLSYPFLRALQSQLTPPMVVDQQPLNAAGEVGGSAQFTASVSGGLAPVTLNWQRNGVDLTEGGRHAGVSGTTLTVSGLTIADEGVRFRLRAVDARGFELLTEEATLSVTGPPVAITNAAPYVAATSATVAGEVNAQGRTTTIWFRYGTSIASQPLTGDASPNQATGTASVPVTGQLVGLTPNTTYYYRIVAQNAQGTIQGELLSFKTAALTPPTVTTLSPVDITPTSARLRGRINARNGQVMAVFEHGTSKTYLWSLPGMPHLVSGSADTEVTAELTGLQPHTRYHYRLAGYGDRGQGVGVDMSFVTTNRSPVGTADNYALCPQSKVVLDVLNNDSDEDGDALRITNFTQPPAGVGKVALVNGSLVVTTGTSVAAVGGAFNYTVTDGFGGTATALVTLTAGSAGLDPTARSLPSAATSYVVQVTSGGGWSVSESLGWISVTPASGYGSGPVTLTFLPNSSKAPRSGTVVIGGQSHSVTQAGVVAANLDVPATIPDGVVGGLYHLVIPTINPPATYKVTNLPKGLRIEQTTGAIVGRPLEAGTKQVAVEARNAANNVPDRVEFAITIHPYPAAGAGTFSALIERGSGIWTGHGGLVTFTADGTGALSGKLSLKDKVFPFRSQLEVPLAGDLTAVVPITLSREHTAVLALHVVIPDRLQLAAQVTGSLTVADGGSGAVQLEGSRWEADTTARAGLYTAVMEAPAAGYPDPEGSGYFVFTAKNSGLVSWSGKLADGTVSSGSSALWPDGEFAFYRGFLRGRASVQGTPRLLLPMAPGLREVSGTLNWLKQAPGELAHPWINSVDCGLRGGEYLPPAAGELVLDLAPVGVGQVNAWIRFTGGGIEDADQYLMLEQDFRVTAAHKAVFSTSRQDNPALVRMASINPKTGVFKGLISLKENGPPVVSRPVSFEGVLLSAEQVGEGFFVLPELPLPPNTSVSRTPRHSGRVQLFPQGVVPP